VAVVLLAALVAPPKARLPGDATVVATLIGTALALVVAHFVAFRLAADLTSESGVAPPPILKEARAGLAGGLSVAALSGQPYALSAGQDALLMTLIALATLPALTGLAIARLRGRSWGTSLLAAGAAPLIALPVVLLKHEHPH
jgi:hypothetical protein